MIMKQDSPPAVFTVGIFCCFVRHHSESEVQSGGDIQARLSPAMALGRHNFQLVSNVKK
jgi:hypothetical protein